MAQTGKPSNQGCPNKKERFNEFWQINKAMGNLLVICQETNTLHHNLPPEKQLNKGHSSVTDEREVCVSFPDLCMNLYQL